MVYYLFRTNVLNKSVIRWLITQKSNGTLKGLSLEPKLGIPYEKLTPLIFILIRACVHYALFEDEFYM